MEIQKKKRNARKYCIDAGKLESRRNNTLDFFLNDDVGNSEQKPKPLFRDADETIEVLVLRKVSEYQYRLVSKEFPFDITHTPDEEDCQTNRTAKAASSCISQS